MCDNIETPEYDSVEYDSVGSDPPNCPEISPQDNSKLIDELYSSMSKIIESLSLDNLLINRQIQKLKLNIDELNKYSYGYKDKFAMCRIYMEKNKLYVSNFNNYVREFYILNKKKFNDIMFKGIGKLLLKNILSYLLIKQEINVDTKIYLEMVNTKNKKLVQFYQSLSFVLLDEDNFSSRVGDILKKLQDFPSIHVHM
jgi:hypothetical protein